MTTSCVNLLHPIDAATVDVLLVGAFAREVLFYHMHGIETGIGTLDTDISVLVQAQRPRHRQTGGGQIIRLMLSNN